MPFLPAGWTLFPSFLYSGQDSYPSDVMCERRREQTQSDPTPMLLRYQYHIIAANEGNIVSSSFLLRAVRYVTDATNEPGTISTLTIDEPDRYPHDYTLKIN